MFVDIHTHRSSPEATKVVLNLSFSEAKRVFSSNKIKLFSVGFHPWFANEFTTPLLDLLEVWANDKRLVAIGECGLDKNSRVPLEQQLSVFEQQIVLAEKVQKPLIIHCVGCFNELLALKRRANPQQLWIIHGFRGKPALANQVLKAGCALSFGEHFNVESVRITPLDKLFVETDESILPIESLYRNIASVKGCGVEELSAGLSLINKIQLCGD